MIGTIATLIIAYWYYVSAEKVNKNPFQWLVLGAVLYYGTRILWTYGVLRFLMGREFVNHSVATGFFIDISGIVAGVVCAALIHWRYLRSN